MLVEQRDITVVSDSTRLMKSPKTQNQCPELSIFLLSDHPENIDGH